MDLSKEKKTMRKNHQNRKTNINRQSGNDEDQSSSIENNLNIQIKRKSKDKKQFQHGDNNSSKKNNSNLDMNDLKQNECDIMSRNSLSDNLDNSIVCNNTQSNKLSIVENKMSNLNEGNGKTNNFHNV